MKKLITFNGLIAIKVALATNRSVEVQDVGQTAWIEAYSWEAKAIANRDIERVRLRGYANVLRQAATGPDKDSVIALIDELANE